jgi:hypothetical protein
VILNLGDFLARALETMGIKKSAHKLKGSLA